MSVSALNTFNFSHSEQLGAGMSPSESIPSKLYLLSRQFIDPVRLKTFASMLNMGYGDKILLPVAHSPLFEANDFEATMVDLGATIPDVSVVDKRWTKVVEDGAVYFINGAPGTCDEVPFMKEIIELCGEGDTLTSPADALSIFSLSGLRVILSTSTGTRYIPPPTLGGGRVTLYLLERPKISFSPLPSFTPFGVPTPDDWRTLWAAWDLVTLGMIPEAMLHQKPIDLRHKCLFYIGHIPTFLDILMSRALGEPNTEPKKFTLIFERGIDPHIDNPEHCHRHSEVPAKDEDWPTLGSVLAFRDRVRERVMRLYSDFSTGKRTPDRRIARMLVITHEHEAWHVETLLYMLIQRAGSERGNSTLPPPGFMPPAWPALAAAWDVAPLPPMSTVVLGPAVLTLGHSDCEGDDRMPGLAQDVVRAFGWDNENPARQVQVGRVRMAWRPVTNEEFWVLWSTGGDRVDMPTSWMVTEQGIQVRTLYGPVPMDLAKHWPVLASYDGLVAYAQSVGGRLPTEAELRLFLDTYDVGHAGGANVGFRHWHPVPATTGLDEHSGKGTNGGVWEWTSTKLSRHPGMFPTAHFPGYTTDFVDGKHHVVLGGSYATVPRLAGRRTVRNFYQRQYPYAWIAARVVYDE